MAKEVEMSPADKHDKGKPRMDLLPHRALMQIADVLTFGVEKYDAHNWRKGLPWSRLVAAAYRHLGAFNEGETFDRESSLHHLAHACCCLMFLLEYRFSHPELDDRYVPLIARPESPNLKTCLEYQGCQAPHADATRSSSPSST